MTDIIRAVLVDDEPLAIEGLRRLLAADPRISVVGEASNGKAGLALVISVTPDVVFLDISMPEGNGRDIARSAFALDPAPFIVFVTAHDQYAAEAFDLAVTDYVLKPLGRERVVRAVDRVAAAVRTRGQSVDRGSRGFWVPSSGTVTWLDSSLIDLIDAERDYVRVVTADRSYLLRSTLTEMMDRLDPSKFLRVHRSTIIARSQILGLRHTGKGAWSVQLACGGERPVGRTYLSKLRARPAQSFSPSPKIKNRRTDRFQ